MSKSHKSQSSSLALQFQQKSSPIDNFTYILYYQEMSKSHKSQSSSLALQFQQKSSPIGNFIMGHRQNQQKINFESRTCKQLIETHFDKVGYFYAMGMKFGGI